jgi:hypothetical protein
MITTITAATGRAGDTTAASLRQSYLLAGCFAAGFLLTAGISLWKSRDAGEMLAHMAPSPHMATAVSPYHYESAPPRAAAPRVNRTAVRLPQPDARPLLDAVSESEAAAQELTPETAQPPEQQARRLARRAAERDGH